MDKNLVDKIVNTSFFNVDDAAELFKENGVSQIKILANGTILCGAAEKCEMLIVFRFKPFGIMAEQSGKEVEGVILGGTEKEAAADSILYKNSDLRAVLRKKDDKLIISTNDETPGAKGRPVLNASIVTCTPCSSVIFHAPVITTESPVIVQMIIVSINVPVTRP